MKTTVEIKEILRQYFEGVAKQQGIVRMALFGSVARNEQTEWSDIDVAYEGEPNLFQRIRMKMDLEQLFNCKVDIVRLRKDLADTQFGDEIQKDLIYV